MNSELWNIISNCFEITIMMCIIIVYIINSMMLIILTINKKSKYRYIWITIYELVISFAFAMTYTIIFVNYISGHPIIASTIGLIATRPLLFLTGCLLVCTTNIKMSFLRNGGSTVWRLIKHKN